MIKKSLLLLCLLFSGLTFAQSDSLQLQQSEIPKKKRAFQKDFNLRLSYIYPNGIGDNYIAKANTGNYGLGLKLNFFAVHNIHFGIVFEHLSYGITDPALSTNAHRTNMNNFSVEFMYQKPVSEKLTLSPKIGIGVNNVTHAGKSKYGITHATKLAVGMYADYKIAPKVEAFLGVEYNYLDLDVETASRYQSFYSNVSLLNVALGFKFNFNRR